MNDAGMDDAAPADPVYSYRPSLFGAPWELRLTPSTLDWQFGRRAGRRSMQGGGSHLRAVTFSDGCREGRFGWSPIRPARARPRPRFANCAW